MSKKKRCEEICPECWNGCMACFNAGKSHVRPVMEQLESARAQLAQRDEELTVLREKVRAVYELVTLFDYTAVYDLKCDLLAALSDDQEGRDE